MRTNLVVLSGGVTTTLIGVLLVSYGGNRILADHAVLDAWYWPALVACLGVCGVLTTIAKGIVRPKWLRRLIGAFALLPFLAGVIVAGQYLELPIVAVSLPPLLGIAYALFVDEPTQDHPKRMLIRFTSSAILMLLAPLSLLFPVHAPMPIGDFGLWVLFAIGLIGGLFHLLRPDVLGDRVAGAATGAALAAFGLASLYFHQPLTAVAYIPNGIILLLLPLFKHYRLGRPDPVEEMSAENKLARQYERLAELISWSIFVFAYLHIYLQRSSGGGGLYVFVTFIICYAGFTIQYRMFPPKDTTYDRLYRESLVDILLIGLLCHFTGGLGSPYVWFFIFPLLTGSVAPKPRKIFDRLYLIICYFAFETIVAGVSGSLYEASLVNGLLLPIFILGLTGLYAFQLSMRHKQVDENLMKANASYKEAFEHETSAKELTLKKSAELGRARKRDDALLAALPDAVIALGADGRINQVNPAAEAILGHPAVEVIGRRLRDLILLKRENDPSFRLGDYLDAGPQGDAVPLPNDLYLEKQEGRKTYYSGMILPVVDDGQNGAVVVLQDVTYVREVDQMKTNFISVAAHQLRTPLSSVRWYLELLADPVEGKLNKDQKSFVDNAYTATLRTVGLVNRLLAITRLEAARVPVHPEPVDLRALTVSILEDESRKLKEHGLEAAVSSPDPLGKIELDPTLTREVFVNLIENAIRYSRKGGKIAIAIEEAGEDTVWSIKDEGIGIPKAQQENIFEKFFRATNAVEYNSEGNGLGLYLAHFIVEGWGGKLTFESREGYGTAFHVTLPKKGVKPKSGQVSLNA